MKLSQFPMPPSINGAYADAMIQGKLRRVKTRPMKDFERDVDTWYLANARSILGIRALLNKHLVPGLHVAIDAVFFIDRSALLTISGEPKRIDTSNRLKALHDQVARIIGVDDRWFWSGSYQTHPIVSKSFEHVDVSMRLVSNS